MGDLELANRVLRQRLEEQKRLEEQLRQAQKMEAVGRFSAGIAHDFNNILTVIFGYSHIMQGKLAGDPALSGMLDTILEAADRAKSLAASLLTFSRKQPLRLARLDLNLALTGVDTFLRRVIGDDVTLAVDPAGEKLPVLADKGHLEQVLMNLAVNARDAMPTGGKLAISACRLVVDERFILEQGYGVPGRYALLSVADSGVGMDQTTCERIFEPFFTTKETGRGTGLGLSIVYGIVQQHHGIIHVASQPGEGTTFHILLPLVECCGGDETLPERQAVPAGGNETILVVDNDEAVRGYLEMFLSTLGYRVLQAADGLEAVQRFRERQGEIDLVLMDLIMPHKTGREAAIEMRVLRSEAKIVFISGYVPDNAGDRQLLPEGAELITKPLVPCDLALKIRQLLDH
jgi:two-component system NtrC family sensor kinase